MPQYLKEEVRDRITDAALAVFSRAGWEGATMAGIAREAGVSTGNIYRYFDDKEALFLAVVPPSFADRFLGLLRRRVDAAGGVEDVWDVPSSHPYPVAAERLLEFSIEHRLRVVILLGRSRGTRYEGVDERIVDELVVAAVEHFRPASGQAGLSPRLRWGLRQIYRNYVRTLVRILARFERPDEIREATEAYTRYHLAGLRALLG